LIDQFDELRGTDVKFKLVWDMMPLSGRLETNFKPGHQLPPAERVRLKRRSGHGRGVGSPRSSIVVS
jgi:hypothetical protein